MDTWFCPFGVRTNKDWRYSHNTFLLFPLHAPSPLLFYCSLSSTTFLLFSLHHHHHRFHHISIVSLHSRHHHYISIVFPTPSPPYSHTSLIRTPKGQNQVSTLQKCPYYRGRQCMIPYLAFLGPNELSVIERCPYREVWLYFFCFPMFNQWKRFLFSNHPTENQGIYRPWSN